mgnify:CR=1 FL=1
MAHKGLISHGFHAPLRIHLDSQALKLHIEIPGIDPIYSHKLMVISLLHHAAFVN